MRRNKSMRNIEILNTYYSEKYMKTKILNKMKTLLTTFILLTAVMLQSCEKDNTQSEQSMELSKTSKLWYTQYNIYTLNGCEYIVVGVGLYRWGSHKGDCKNPIHYAK